MAVETLTIGAADLTVQALIHILAHGAIDELESSLAVALVGAQCVPARSPQALNSKVCTLIHIFTCAAISRNGVASITSHAGVGALGVEAESGGTGSLGCALVNVFTTLPIGCHLIAPVAGTSERAIQVDTLSMGTGSLHQALVHIDASSVPGLIAVRTADTPVGARGIDTLPMGTRAGIHALIDIFTLSSEAHGKALLALATVGAGGVDTSLSRTCRGLLTFISILTALLALQENQSVPRVAEA